MRAWVVGRGKRFTQYIVRFPTETPIRCQRSELFTHSREKPNTGRDKRLTPSRKITVETGFLGLYRPREEIETRTDNYTTTPPNSARARGQPRRNTRLGGWTNSSS